MKFVSCNFKTYSQDMRSFRFAISAVIFLALFLTHKPLN